MSFSGERIGFEPQAFRAPEPIVVFIAPMQLPALMQTEGFELSRAHKGRQGEKKDHNGSMPYKQGGPTRREGPQSKPKRPNGGHQQPGSNGPRPH